MNKIQNPYNAAGQLIREINRRSLHEGNGIANKPLPSILFISSYPPRQCGIASYTQDLVQALGNKFTHSFRLQICALETAREKHNYPGEVQFRLQTDDPASYSALQKAIQDDPSVSLVMLEHEFGFYAKHENHLHELLHALQVPVLITFHTVLPAPDDALLKNVQEICRTAAGIIVMTQHSKEMLVQHYSVQALKISVIPHGTHLVPHKDKNLLKEKYGLTGKKVLSTFGLLSAGKSIETTLSALPAIVLLNPDVLFLIIGKTHPGVINSEGEQYRESLVEKTKALNLTKHVRFINAYLPLEELLDYLQLTDIYIFSSRDPNQAVSGTFSYAISCGCPVISTPIPHAREVLPQEGNMIFDFGNAAQLSKAIVNLLADDIVREKTGINSIQQTASTAWENTAIAHALLFEQLCKDELVLHYSLPPVNLDHFKKLTTSFGMIQFSMINRPDIQSGYTLDDNARALVAMCRHFELTGDISDLPYIKIYFKFIKYCLQPEGHFLNYVKEERFFSGQNNEVNLADANGRAIWALGYLLSLEHILPLQIIEEADAMMSSAQLNAGAIHSTRAMAFVIKGLYYRNKETRRDPDIAIIVELANRLLQMYRHEKKENWHWYESYLTYANSLLPEAMLCAWLATGEQVYKDTARESFDFLLSKIFVNGEIKVISNKNWLHQGLESSRVWQGGEQPIDVAYTILALKKFSTVFKDKDYKNKMTLAFEWFLGKNHLHQIIYNPCTGGCYDGLEEKNVNLNQGAESTVSCLLARLALEKTPCQTTTHQTGKQVFMETAS